MHAVSVFAEVLHVGFGQNIGFGKYDRVADAPLKKFPERAEHVVLLTRPPDMCSLGADHEWHSVHSEAGDAKLNPEAHDFQNFSLNCWVRCVEIRLEVVE